PLAGHSGTRLPRSPVRHAEYPKPDRLAWFGLRQTRGSWHLALVDGTGSYETGGRRSFVYLPAGPDVDLAAHGREHGTHEDVFGPVLFRDDLGKGHSPGMAEQVSF